TVAVTTTVRTVSPPAAIPATKAAVAMMAGGLGGRGRQVARTRGVTAAEGEPARIAEMAATRRVLAVERVRAGAGQSAQKAKPVKATRAAVAGDDATVTTADEIAVAVKKKMAALAHRGRGCRLGTPPRGMARRHENERGREGERPPATTATETMATKVALS
ncbi:unnamed protein product, partial [Ectocarpus sp. 12 AP-2014]